MIQKHQTLVSIKYFINVLLQLLHRWVRIKRFIYKKIYTELFTFDEWKKASEKEKTVEVDRLIEEIQRRDGV